jgi:hypothetical protein
MVGFPPPLRRLGEKPMDEKLQAFIASALMDSWFPNTERTELLSKTDLYKAWWDCAMMDAATAMKAVAEYTSDDRK